MLQTNRMRGRRAEGRAAAVVVVARSTAILLFSVLAGILVFGVERTHGDTLCGSVNITTCSSPPGSWIYVQGRVGLPPGNTPNSTFSAAMPVLAILQNAQHYDVYTAISGCPTSHMVPCTTEGIGCNGQYNCGTGCRYAYSEVGGGPNNTVHVTYALAPTTMLTNDSDCSTVLSWNIGALNDYRNPVCITPLEFAVECPVPVTSSPATLRPTTHAPELPKIPAVVFVVIVLSSLCACSLLIGGVFMLECRRVGDARGSYRQLQTP